MCTCNGCKYSPRWHPRYISIKMVKCDTYKQNTIEYSVYYFCTFFSKINYCLHKPVENTYIYSDVVSIIISDKDGLQLFIYKFFFIFKNLQYLKRTCTMNDIVSSLYPLQLFITPDIGPLMIIIINGNQHWTRAFRVLSKAFGSVDRERCIKSLGSCCFASFKTQLHSIQIILLLHSVSTKFAR